MNPKNGVQEEQKQFGDKPEMRDATTNDFRLMEERVLNAKQGMRTVNCRGFQSMRYEESRHQADSKRHSNL